MELQNPFLKKNPFYKPDHSLQKLQNYLYQFNLKKNSKKCQHCEKIVNQKNNQNFRTYPQNTKCIESFIISHSHPIEQIKKMKIYQQNVQSLKVKTINPFYRSSLISNQSFPREKQNVEFFRKDNDFLRKLKQIKVDNKKNIDKEVQNHSNCLFPSFGGILSHKSKQINSKLNKQLIRQYQINVQKYSLRNKNISINFHDEKNKTQQEMQKIISQNENKVKLNLNVKTEQNVGNIKLHQSPKKAFQASKFKQQQILGQIKIKNKVFYLNIVEKLF